MAQIFLSYRRDDTRALAGRIVDSLRSKLGKHAVYLDIDTVPPGVDFRTHVDAAIAECDFVLLLIGEQWAAPDDTGKNRLFDTSDPVRLEIQAAIAHNVAIIPLLAGKTEFPTKDAFPEEFADLAYRNAYRIDDGVDYHNHIDRLVKQIREIRQQRVQAHSEDEKAPYPIADPEDEPTSEFITPAADKATAGLINANTLGRVPLTIPQGLAVVGFLVSLNSILAALGSMLWGQIHYWPAFMVYALACAYFGYWGVLVAILSPIVSSLLLIGGAPAWMYIPSNAIQALLVIAVFRLVRLDPGLPTNIERMKYLIFGAMGPSIVGGALAWVLRKQSGIGASDPSLLVYSSWWTLENALPVIVPGFWLHSVVASIRRPFEWSKTSYLTSWVGRAFEYTAPWVLTLFISLSISIFLVASRLGEAEPTGEAWSQIRLLAGESFVFRILVLAGCVSVLIAVGFSVRHARQTWHLEQAIRRNMPSAEDAKRILVGQSSPNTRKVVSVAVFRLGNFRMASRRLRPAQLVNWINSCYDCIDAAARQFASQVDYFATDGTLVIFDAQEKDLHADLALLSALDAIERIATLNAEMADQNCPECRLTVAINTGPVIASEIGTVDRRRYTVVGPTVDVARQIALESAANGMQSSVTFSLATLRELGIGRDTLAEAGLCERGILSIEEVEPTELYGVEDPRRLVARLAKLAAQ